VSNPNELVIAPAITGLTASDSFTAEATTSATLIYITGHLQTRGNIIYNATRDEYRVITKIIDANSFNVETVTGQVVTDVIYMNGDVIVFYPESSNIIRNTLKKQGIIPETVTFRTKSILFNPGEKIDIKYGYLGIEGSFLIEEVRISCPLNTMDIFYADITCTSRKPDNFSTQRRDSFIEYFGGL